MQSHPALEQLASQSPSRRHTRPPGAEVVIVRLVARAFRVREGSILAPGRAAAREALARHVAMYLAHVALGWTFAEIAALFGRHRTSVNYACARVEDRRDEARFDALVTRLETRLAAVPAGAK